jgi:hypothetical protein
MSRLLRRLALASLAAVGLGCGAVRADPVTVEARFVTEGEPAVPMAGQALRIAVGNGAALRRAGAGTSHTTDAAGRLSLTVDAPVIQRRIKLDNPFASHDAWFVEVGVELDLVGRPALYVVQLDLMRDGALGVITANLKGAGGDFDAPLVFHPDTHSWSFPGEPEGWRLTSIGANLTAHDMQGSPQAGWTVRIELSKQNFTVR